MKIKNKEKIVFFGQDEYSLVALDEIYRSGQYKIAAVVTLPDKPQGRKNQISPGPVKLFAQKHHLHQIDYQDSAIEIARNQSSGLGVLASFGAIIKKQVIDLFPKGILVIHPSLLPKYRGASPVQTAIMSGEQETGVTIFVMDEKVDHGPTIGQFKKPISSNDTSEVVLKKLFSAGAKVLVEILPAYLEGKIKSQPQNELEASYTQKLTKDQAMINWQKPPGEIYNQIRAMTSWPGAWTEIIIKSPRLKRGRRKRLKILKARLDNNQLMFDQVQLQGKKPVTWKQFCQGYPEARIIKT